MGRVHGEEERLKSNENKELSTVAEDQSKPESNLSTEVPAMINTKSSDKASPPKPPARSKASRMDSTSSENKNSQEATGSSSSAGGAAGTSKVPINHQDSVQPQQSTGIIGWIKGVFSCMTSRK